ncbi:MAG: mannose-6-phosphate isomerase [Bacteroidales bacterium]|nr:MAG: mannose-6-phosphate isomerase [Bacteroidales bacterium]
MDSLYPLKFEPIYKDYIWGGTKLRDKFNRSTPANITNCAESWEISSIEDNISVVINGFLAGNNLQEIIEIYMGDLVGDKVFNEFGDEFPLLIKLIDATDTLSIQVHPDNQVAKERHHAFGKTEMWYIIDSEANAQIITGFNKEITIEEYQNHQEKNTLKEILNTEKAEKDDIFFIPPGRIHAIGKGIMLAEIQQASDITYRIYDWQRVDKNGTPRELHTDLALGVIDFKKYNTYKFSKKSIPNSGIELIKCEFFTTNRLSFNKTMERDYNLIDSFIVMLCIDGICSINYGEGLKETLSKGETILIPAELKNIILEPSEFTTILEIFIE